MQWLTHVADEQRTFPFPQMRPLPRRLVGHKLMLLKANSFELFWANFQTQQTLLLLQHLPPELLELSVTGDGVSMTEVHGVPTENYLSGGHPLQKGRAAQATQAFAVKKRDNFSLPSFFTLPAAVGREILYA